MRAIDADALEKYLSNAEIEATRQRKYVFASALNTICGNIRNLPTIEPERKVGKWQIYVISPFDGEGCKCSECKYEGAPYWDFCPNCGARMEEGD